jgi:GNAT superfamily N-acetyltransferase
LPCPQERHHAIIRSYRPTDRSDVRAIYGDDEFARPQLARRYPGLRAYLADSMSYYPDYEPESLFVADVQGAVVGALLGAVDTRRSEEITARRVRWLIWRRMLAGAYGWPIWLVPIVRTELAVRRIVFPQIDQVRYPAHLHIGILPAWRRQGIGTQLMAAFAAYLQQQGVPGYHLHASSFHPMGVAFYRKLGLEELDRFTWPFHDGSRWLEVTEFSFSHRLPMG